MSNNNQQHISHTPGTTAKWLWAQTSTSASFPFEISRENTVAFHAGDLLNSVMEESKNIFKFEGDPGEDYRIWEARTEAALEAKEVLLVVPADVVGDRTTEIDAAVELHILKTRATIIQAIGIKPTRMIMSVRYNRFEMCKRLQELYSTVNIASKVQLQSQLSRKTYQGEKMADYVASFEELFNHLKAMDSKIDEDLRVAMLLASFGDKNKSLFGHFIVSLQSTARDVNWDTVSARLIQKYDEQTWAATYDRFGSTRKMMVMLHLLQIAMETSGLQTLRFQNAKAKSEKSADAFHVQKLETFRRTVATRINISRRMLKMKMAMDLPIMQR